MGMIKNDEQYLTALTRCSPKIVSFLKALNDKDSRIRWDRLERDGCIQSDGSIFRIVSSIRTAKQQVAEYKKGRKNVKSTTELALFPNDYVSDCPATYYRLENKGIVDNKAELSTNAWAGESRHNWGLAVDIVIRKWGDVKIIPLSDGAMSVQNYYSLIGLTQLAKDCGLDWGGDWSNFVDVAHFEDNSVNIPSKEYFYDKNMSYEFLQRLAENGGLAGSTKKISKLSLAKGGLMAVGAYCLYRIFRGKK